jgi:hypothetical protein
MPVDNAGATYAARQAALGAKAGTDILEIFTGLLREPVCLTSIPAAPQWWDGNLNVPAGSFNGLQYWDPATNATMYWSSGLNPATDKTILSAYSLLIYSKSVPTTNCAKRMDPVTIGSGVPTTWFGYTAGGATADNVGGGTQNCRPSLLVAQGGTNAAADPCLNIGTDVYYYVDTNNQLIRSVVGLQGAARVNEVIASYVDDLQISYAQDGRAAAADNLIQSADWGNGATDVSKVRMAKISIVMRSKNIDPAKTAALAPVLENSTVAFGAADQYRRRVFTRTVRLRNMEVN